MFRAKIKLLKEEHCRAGEVRKIQQVIRWAEDIADLSDLNNITSFKRLLVHI